MSKKISFCALMSVLGILSIFAASIIRTNTVFFFLLSTLFTYISTEEYDIKYGMLTFAVITLVSYFLYPNKVTVGFYAVSVGYYPAVKHVIEHLNIYASMKWMFKIIAAFLSAFVGYLIFKQFLSINLAFTLILIAGVVILAIYDMALTAGIKFYALKLRKYK